MLVDREPCDPLHQDAVRNVCANGDLRGKIKIKLCTCTLPQWPNAAMSHNGPEVDANSAETKPRSRNRSLAASHGARVAWIHIYRVYIVSMRAKNGAILWGKTTRLRSMRMRIAHAGLCCRCDASVESVETVARHQPRPHSGSTYNA